MKNAYAFCAAALVASLLATSTQAQVKTFTGLGDGTTWSDPGNWSPAGGPPGGADAAIIDAGGDWDVTLSNPTSFGTLSLGAGDSLEVSTFATAGGIAQQDGELIISPGAFFNLASSWQNDGTISFNNGGTLGTPSSAHTITNGVNGVLRGEAPPLSFITTTFVNHGTLSPGMTANDAGAMSIDAATTLTSTSVVDIEIGGGTSGFSYDIIQGLGNTTLGGTLQLTQFDGYNPDPSASLVIMGSVLTNGITGEFDNVASGERLNTTDGSGSWLVLYGPTSGLSNSNVVLTDWQPVPEPSSLALLGLGGLLIARRRRA